MYFTSRCNESGCWLLALGCWQNLTLEVIRTDRKKPSDRIKGVLPTTNSQQPLLSLHAGSQRLVSILSSVPENGCSHLVPASFFHVNRDHGFLLFLDPHLFHCD